MDIGQFGEKENVFVPSGVLGLVKCQICLLDQLVGIVLPGRTPPMGDADAQRDAAIGQGRDWRGVGSLQELLGKRIRNSSPPKRPANLFSGWSRGDKSRPNS